jgi:hypothetical protein
MGNNPQTEVVTMTAKTCRYCRRPYLSPKGARWHGCKRCAPTVEDAILAAGSDGAGEVRPGATQNIGGPRDDGIPF